MTKAKFEWDEKKNRENQEKHGVAFELAHYAFADLKKGDSHFRRRLLAARKEDV